MEAYEYVLNNAGARFMLNGVDKDGNLTKIKSVYAQVKNGSPLCKPKEI